LNLHGVLSGMARGPGRWREVAWLREKPRRRGNRAASLHAPFVDRLGPGLGPTLRACSSASRSKWPRSVLGRLSTAQPSLSAATSVAPAPRRTWSVWFSAAEPQRLTRSLGSPGGPSPSELPSPLAVAIRAARAVRAAFTGASHQAEPTRSTLPPSPRRHSHQGFPEPGHRPGRASESTCLRARGPRFPSSARAGSATVARPRSPR
jgi:hypothetical protein